MVSDWRYQKQMIHRYFEQKQFAVCPLPIKRNLDCCYTDLLLDLLHLIVAPRIFRYRTPNAGLPYEVIPCFQGCRGLWLLQHEHSTIDEVRLQQDKRLTPIVGIEPGFPLYRIGLFNNNRLLVICHDTTKHGCFLIHYWHIAGYFSKKCWSCIWFRYRHFILRH